MVDDVVGKDNLFESLRSCDDNLSRAEYTRGDLLHVLGWLKLHLDCRIPVWFERHLEHVGVSFKMVGRLQEVDVVIQTKVGVDHHHTERIYWGYHLFVKLFQYVLQAGDDVFTVDEIVASSHLNTSVGKYLDGFCAVTIIVGQCNLIIKSGGFEFPRDTLGRQCIFV